VGLYVIKGQANEKQKVNYFTGHKQDTLTYRKLEFRAVRRYTLIEEFLGVFAYDPHEVETTIEKHPVNMLKFVKTPLFLAVVKAEKHPCVEVIVHSFHIGVGMVIHHVLLFPEIGIATQKVQGIGHDGVNLGVAGITVVATVMHDVKTD
jgi:hypothetical protein